MSEQCLFFYCNVYLLFSASERLEKRDNYFFMLTHETKYVTVNHYLPKYLFILWHMELYILPIFADTEDYFAHASLFTRLSFHILYVQFKYEK